MRNLTATICLAVALLLSSVGVSLGNDSREASVASNAVRCSSLYLIATSAFGADKATAKSLMAVQRLFDGIYSGNAGKQTQKKITNGMISKRKSDSTLKLGSEYDRNPETIYLLEMNCSLWRQKIVEALQTAKRRGVDPHSIFLTMTDIPTSASSSNSRWSRSKVFVDLAFSAWTKKGRRTPHQMLQEFMKDLKQ